MAGGYLGKISAVISANTGDYVRGLNEGAKATRDFAKTVQSTLNRSATEAAKAFEGIYTPLQQFERAIRQAGALRLNFKGFEGAVRNINDLQKRLNGVLTSNEIDLVVRTSGLKDIEAVRQAINSLSKKEITLASNAGGLPGLLKARAELDRTGAGATKILNTKATQAELDALIEKLNVLDDRRIELIIDVVNQRGLEEAITRARRLQEVATQIAAPLSASAAEFTRLSQAAQGQFAPALGAAQRAVEQFQTDIEQLGASGRSAFQGLKADVDIVRAAISRLSEVQALTSNLFTGQELNFVNPEIVDTLRRVQAAQQQLAAAPAGVRGSPLGREVIADAQILQEQLNRVQARIERIRAEGGDIKFSQRGLDVILQRLRQAAEETERLSARGVGLDFVARQGNPDGTFGPPRPFTRLPPAYFNRRFSARPGDPDGEFGPPLPPDLARQRQIAREQARLASGFLRVNQQESDNISNQGLSTPLTGSRAPRTRVLDGLRGEVDTTRRLIGDLAGPLREQLGPEVDRINNEFRQLARDGLGVSADAARRLSGEVNAITASLQRRRDIGREFSGQFGGRGAAGLGVGVDQQSLRAIGGQIEFVQQRLGRLTADVRGPTLQALERFRATASRLFDAGTIDTESGRRELELLRQELAQTLSAAGGGSVRSLTQGLRRSGDVARGGFDRLSLGIQQAAFAVEDFFSVTGGLDQRVRAAGNNISQLGFILGGTSGLIAGIAGAIGSQLIVALIKWANAGRTTEDQMKAINDVLSRQKSLVEELADAFRSLGDSIGRNAFSPAARDADEFQKSLDDIRKKQRELREQRAFGLDEGVLQARADVNVAQNALDRATTRDAAVAAQRQLDEARARLENEQNRVRFAAGPNAQRGADEIFARARDNAAALAAATAGAAGGGAGAAQGAARIAFDEGERIRRRVAESLANAGDEAGRVRVLRQEQRQAEARGDTRVVAELEKLLNSIETSRVTRALDEAAIKIFESANRVGQSLERSQAVVSAAIEAGIPGAENFSAQVSDAARALREATTQLSAAESITGPGRQQAIDAARRAVQAAEQRADALAGQARNFEAATSALQRFTDALQATTRIAEANLNSAEGRRDRAREEALGRPTPRNERALWRAERDVQRQRELVEYARRVEAQAVERARQSPEAQADERRLREIEGLLSGADGFIDQAGRRRLIDERERLRERQEARARAVVEDAEEVTGARELSIREEQRQRSAARGRDLLLRPGERERLDLEQQITEIMAESNERRGLDVFGRERARIEQEEQAAIGRAREEAARSLAPTIFGLADQVQNAILQGPSRAALAPTDVTTMEGSRELTRLLRGDDASRNQDLVNLQKEANRLLRLLADNGADVAA